MNPTLTYSNELQIAFDHFNAGLFNGELPQCILTLQRKNQTCGYYSGQRWANVDGEMVDEIALNPEFFSVVPIVEVLQTLVHEMCHQWQHHFGTKPRRGYHDRQWANKMESIGLMPSSTSQPGGAKTGQSMGDYAIEGGLFLKICKELLDQKFKISWFDRRKPITIPHNMAAMSGVFGKPGVVMQIPHITPTPAQNAITEAQQAEFSRPKPTRSKYMCECKNIVYGKAGLKIKCCDCDEIYIDQGGT